MQIKKPSFWNNINFFSTILFPFSLISNFYNFLKNLKRKKKYNIKVICVGNIYLGGTGKTPLTLEIFSMLENLKRKPAFIRKKYDNQKDEVTLQKQIGPVYESSKRINAIDKATKDGKDIFILDDGFQDLSINKDLTIICFNEKQWIGNGLVIPAGPLRENLTALKRAECIIINGSKNIHIEKKILDINSNIKIFYSKYVALNISSFKNKDVIAFAGIGNNKNFFHLLESNEIKILKKVNFPDHYNYSNRELENLVKSAKEKNAILLTTEKDYLRINKEFRQDLGYIEMDLEIVNEKQFLDLVSKK